MALIEMGIVPAIQTCGYVSVPNGPPLRVTVLEQGVRVADSDLARFLGYARTSSVRRCIQRLCKHLWFTEENGMLVLRGSTIGRRGRPTITYYLTFEQAAAVAERTSLPLAKERLASLEAAREEVLCGQKQGW